MDAKTQEAAGVLVRGTLRVSFHPEDYADRRWVATRTDNTNIWAESLYLLANHLNLDVEEFNRCAALMEPVTPRETALAAPTGAPVDEMFEDWYERLRRERGGSAGPLESLSADAGQMLLAAYYDSAAVSDRLGSAMESAQDWLAARLVSAMQDAQDCLPAPSAPQEPRGMCAEHRKVVMDGCVHCATARVAARRAALSPEARDAD